MTYIHESCSHLTELPCFDEKLFYLLLNDKYCHKLLMMFSFCDVDGDLEFTHAQFTTIKGDLDKDTTHSMSC